MLLIKYNKYIIDKVYYSCIILLHFTIFTCFFFHPLKQIVNLNSNFKPLNK